MYQIIHTTIDLEEFCKKLANNSFITVDTEFLRERTYFPNLCLVQVASGDDESLAAIIDPLSKGIDLQPLFEILQNEKIIKVMHSGKQDIEIFHNINDGKVPYPVFDTQIAAMFCGMGEQIGYESIVNKTIGKSVNKAHQFTDWARRPLSEDQLNYAICDVTFLRDVYRKLLDSEIPKERVAWVEAETEQKLTDPELYSTSPDKAWQRIKKKNSKPAYLNRLRTLCEWREKRAINENKPRGWILHDDAIQEIALTNPTSVEKLQRIRAIKSHRGGLKLEELLDLVKTANAEPKEKQQPIKINKRFPSELEPARDFLKLILKQQAETHNIAPKLLASIDDLNDFLQNGDDTPFLSGWRYELFGQFAKAAMKGEISVSLCQNNNKMLVFSEAKS